MQLLPKRLKVKVTGQLIFGGLCQSINQSISKYLEWAKAMLICEIKLFENNFSLRRRPSEIILFQRVDTCMKLFHRLIAAHEYFPACSLSMK